MSEREPKTCYHYNPDTGEHVGRGDADPDPLVDKNWLVPANATLEEPPEATTGKAAVFVGGQWELVTDDRGPYYLPDGSKRQHTELGTERPPEATDEPPAPTLQQRTAEVDKIRQRLYHEQVDPITMEATLKRAMGEDGAAESLLAQAVEKRNEIQASHPWPTK